MPYIKNRGWIDRGLAPLLVQFAEDANVTEGELNYILTTIVMTWLHSKGKRSYVHLNAVLGVFDAAAREFYRRVVAPYEDDKRAINGDVYGEDFDPRGMRETIIGPV